MSLATRIAQEFNNVRSHISGITAYHLLQGNLSVSNEVITNGFSTTLYTGNGGTQAINTGVDMSTQWGNDTSEQFGGLVWGKSRSSNSANILIDSIRGVSNTIFSNLTNAQDTSTGRLLTFNSNGFTVGSHVDLNINLATYASWNFQTTHRRTGVTNHGKAYTEHYNPFTGFTIIKYEGSGIAGHEIPHSLGRKLGFITIKNLSAVTDWDTIVVDAYYLHLNDTIAAITIGPISNKNAVIHGVQTSTQQYIMYGWANSYYDETNKLIGNYEVGVYQGTGVAGNKVTTRGKPAWIMIKRLDAVGDWVIMDNIRTPFGANRLFPQSSSAEVTIGSILTGLSNGFRLGTADTYSNASGGQYLYMAVYDNDSGSGKSKYPKATDTSNVQINNALIPLAHGVDSNGSKNSIVIANETITGLTYTQGKNYLYKTDTGYGVKPYEPRYLSSELVRRFAGEQPDYYDVDSNKWFNCNAGSELVSNGKFDGGVTTWWTAVSSTLSIVNNTIRVTSSNTNSYGQANTDITTVVGKKYKIVFTLNAKSNSQAGLFVEQLSGIVNSMNIISTGISLVAGTYSFEFIAQTTTTYIKLVAENGSGYWAQFDNISVFPVDITPTTEITESRNYLNHIVHADQNGQVTYVEELPKIEYKDVIKANEYRVKNACTAWVNFDGTTTPPTIRDSYNVASVVRTATGNFDVYFEEPMDNVNYSVNNTSGSSVFNQTDSFGVKNTNKVVVICTNGSAFINAFIDIHIFGGRN